MTKNLTARQNQILNSTVDIIHVRGIQGFTIKNLAKEVGVTEAAVYRHFKSKDEILCAVLDVFIGKLLKLMEVIKGSDQGSLEKIEQVFSQLANTFTNRPAYVSVIFAEEIFKNSKPLSVKVGKILDINNESFESIIGDGQIRKEITNDINNKDLALIVMGSFRLMVKQWKMCCFAFDLVERSESLLSSLKMYLLFN